MHRPGVKPAMFRSRVQRPTTTPPRQTLTYLLSYTTGNCACVVVQISGHGDSVGNKTECALLSHVVTCLGQNYDDLRLTAPESSFRKLYTFNSQRKYMATVVPRTHSPGGADADHAHGHAYRLYVKGAAEVIVGRSVHRGVFSLVFTK